MTFIKRNKVFHARIKSTESKSGYVSVTTKETDLARAKQRVKDTGLDKIEAAAQTHRLTSEGVSRILAGKRITIARTIDAWAQAMTNSNKSPRTISNSLEVVNRWANDMGLGRAAPLSLTPRHVGDWINSPDSKAGANTRRISLSVIGKFLEFCTYSGWNMGNQARACGGVKMDGLSHQQKETKVRQAFTKKEVRDLLDTIEDTFWKFVTRLGYETGLRLGDICQLEWDCFAKDGEVAVWTDKRNQRVAVPISEELTHLLTEIPVRDAKYLFPDERRIVLDPDRRASLSVQFKRRCERAGIEGKSFHCLRHTFVQTHRELGQTWDQIAQALGHACEETTKGYAGQNVGGRKTLLGR